MAKELKIGDRVHVTNESWEGGKYKFNAIIKALVEYPGGYGLRKGMYYFIEPTEESISEVYDVDAQELSSERKQPQTYYNKSQLALGWVDDIGYI